MMKNAMTIENQIDALYAQFHAECEDIALQCAEEGYPSHGSNYDLRTSSLWEDYYRPEVEYLEERLEEEKRKHLFVSLFDALPGHSQCLFNQYRNGLQPDPVLTGHDGDGFPVWSN